jgi:DNA-binding response OmpR family regulator
MLKILIIEDEKALSDTLIKGLEMKGYFTYAVYDGVKAKVLDWNKYDLVLLDWDLPGINGLDLLRYKRNENWFGCCMMLTAKNNLYDRVNSLDFGADDYMSKPFEWEELYSRVNSCIRRRYGFGTSELNGIEWDKDNKLFYENSEIVKLTETEYEILALFFEYPKRIYSKWDIIEKIYGSQNSYPDSNVIERHISKLRNKFNYEIIQTIPSMGYRLRSSSTASKIKD